MRVLVFGLLFLALGRAYGVDLSSLGSGEPVGSLSSYGVDEEGIWDWDEAWTRSKNFAPMNPRSKSLGYVAHTVWFRVDWNRGAVDDRQLYLVSWLIHLNHHHVRFHTENGWTGGTHHWGATEKNEQPRLAPLALEIPALDHGSLLIRVSSNTNIQFDPRIYDLAHLTWARVGASVFLGAVLGFLFLTCLVALFLGFRLQDRLFLWYSAYVGSLTAFLLAYTGFVQSFFPESIGLEDLLDQPLNGLVFLMATIFAYKANATAKWRWEWLLYVVVGLGILFGLVVYFGGNHGFGLQWSSWVLLVLSLGIELGAVVQAFRGNRFSRFFVVGWSILLLSSSWVALGTNGVPGPWEDIVLVSFCLLAGVVVENIIVAAAMADRVSRVYKELDHQRARAARADRLASIGVMTAQVGHEINSPNHVIVLKAALLDSVQNRAEILSDEAELDPLFKQAVRDMRPLIKGIREASGQIHRVIQDLGETTSGTSPAVRVDLSALVRKMDTLYSGNWREKTRRLAIRAAGGGTAILGVEHRLHQLVVNLVNNGLQALGSPNRALSVIVRRAPHEVLLVVTDEGCGMTDEAVARLGKAFFTTRQKEGGTGLGWRLCQEIVREHRGQIEVASVVDRGTTVTVRFPTY